MIIEVKVKPNSKREYVKRLDENRFEVGINSPPIDGRANKRLIELLSDFFGIPKDNIKILRGEKSRNKVVEVRV
ncbi:MAG: DUF167 domain-containing protein [candidate division WOR-3 bacterium]